MDELDALAPSRQHSNSEHERQATARLLAAVDELRRSRCRVGLVGATNRRSAVDSALRRAGRLDSEVGWLCVWAGLGRAGWVECVGVLRISLAGTGVAAVVCHRLHTSTHLA